MSFINRNVNMFLFFLIILVVIIMLGGTVFYGGRFTNVTANYNEMVKQVEDLNKELIKYKAQYNYSEAVLAKTATEKENLKKVYTTQTGRLESDVQILNSTLSKSQSELTITKSELENAKEKLESAESRAESRQEKINCYKDLLTQNIIADSCG